MQHHLDYHPKRYELHLYLIDERLISLLSESPNDLFQVPVTLYRWKLSSKYIIDKSISNSFWFLTSLIDHCPQVLFLYFPFIVLLFYLLLRLFLSLLPILVTFPYHSPHTNLEQSLIVPCQSRLFSR